MLGNWGAAAIAAALGMAVGPGQDGGGGGEPKGGRGFKSAKDVTYLYQKITPNNEHLKYGVAKNPLTRYTQEELGGGRLKILAKGERKDMLKLKRDLHETLPIRREGGQKFHIEKQINSGLLPLSFDQ